MRDLWRVVVALAMWSSMGYSCKNDGQCQTHEVCCGRRCKSWPKCFINTNEECFYDTHCVKGAICVSNVCKPKNIRPKKCSKDQDCVYQKHSKTYNTLYNTSRCCGGKCFKSTQSCLHIRINSTTITPNKRLKPTCLTNYNCPTEFKCIGGKCSLQNNAVETSKRRDSSNDSTLSRAGFLSAAILTSAVFLTVMCFCFLKETKYVRRHIERGQAREILTESACTTTQPVLHDTSHNSTPSWLLFPRLQVYSDRQRHDEVVNDDLSGINPPSYRSVCFEHELPPSYDEAVNNRSITTANNC